MAEGWFAASEGSHNVKKHADFFTFSWIVYRRKSPTWARANIERLALSQLHVLGIGCGKRTPFAQRIAFTFVSQVWQGLRVLPFLRVRIYASSG